MFQNIFRQLLFCALLCQISCNALTFHFLLATFSECSITYYHLINNTTFQIKATTGRVDLAQMKLHFENALLQQMFASNSSAKKFSLTSPMWDTIKLALCSVLVFPQEHVELLRDLTITSKSSGDYPYFHAEFIWFLKTTDSEQSPGIANSYLEAVSSHLHAVYLEIAKFSIASLVLVQISSRRL